MLMNNVGGLIRDLKEKEGSVRETNRFRAGTETDELEKKKREQEQSSTRSVAQTKNDFSFFATITINQFLLWTVWLTSDWARPGGEAKHASVVALFCGI